MKKTAVICIITCLATLGFAAESEPHAEADTRINENEPSNNYGAEEFLSIWGGQVMPPTPLEQSLVQFDDKIFEELRTAGMVIDLAVLKLYVSNLVQTGGVETYRIASPWMENAVTWDTRPDSNLDIISMSTLPSGANQWFETEVTDIARSWLDETFPVLGFYVTVPEQGNSVGCQFVSINHSDSSMHPRLFIEYHEGPGVTEVEPEAGLEVSSLSAGTVTISFLLDNPSSVSLRIYDVSGVLVDNLVEGSFNPGTYNLSWTGSPGVYYVRLVTNQSVCSSRIAVVE